MTAKEELKAETLWFHVFKEMIDNGDIAKLGPHAVTVYLVIKSHSNFSNGTAFPSIETICKKSGISESQVKRSLKALELEKYLVREKKGRNNIYTLREQIAVHDGKGEIAAKASWDYLPSTVQSAVLELKNLVLTGDFAGAKIIHIDRLIQQNNLGSGTAIQINATTEAEALDVLAKLTESDPETAALLQKIKARRDSKKSVQLSTETALPDTGLPDTCLPDT